MKWPRLQDILAFQPPVDAVSLLPGDEDDLPTAIETADAPQDPDEVRAIKTRFDNTIRLWVSIPTYLICIALWLGGAISHLGPMTVVFLSFVALQFLAISIYLNTRFSRSADFVLSGLDLLAMSFSIYYTGGVHSPLYFIYFVPLIVHAFHRDWSVILFNGFGGVLLYGVAVLMSLTEVRAAALTDLAARLLFMLLTVAIACLALNLLRRKDDVDRGRILRLRAVSVLMHRLNRACSSRDIGGLVAEVAPVVAASIGGERCVDVRALLKTDRSTLRVAGDPHAFAVPLPSCPVAAGRVCVSNHPSDSSLECHWESPAQARLCVPIAISDGEVFGVLSVSAAEPGAFTDEEQRFIRFVARSISMCAHRLQQMEELRHAVEMGSCVTAAYLASAHSMQATMEAVIDGALSLVEADQATIFLWNDTTERVEALATRGERAADERGLKFSIGEGVVGGTFESHEARWTSNIQEDAVYRERKSAIKSLLSLPLQTIKGEMVGVLTISRTTNRAEFQDEEIAIASTFAHRAAHALRAAEFRDQAFRRGGPPHAEAA